MTADYKRDMNHSYLIFTTETAVDTSSYPVRMLLGNTVPALLKCRMQGLDGKALFYYEITSRQSLPSFYENRLLGVEDLQFILGCFIEIMEKLEEYLLDSAQLVLNPDYIFLDLARKELRFCYLPGYDKPVEVQFRMLVEYLLPKIDHGDTRAVALGYGVYRKTLEEEFHLEDIREELYQIRGGGKKSVPSERAASLETDSDREPETEPTEEVWKRIVQKQDEIKKDTFLCDVEERFSWDTGRKKEEKKKKQKKEKKDTRIPDKKKPEKDSSDKEGRKKNLRLLAGCTAGTLFLLLILLASQFGYIPQLRTQDIFGTAVIVLGIVIFLYLFFPNISGKKKKEIKEANRILQNAGKRQEHEGSPQFFKVDMKKEIAQEHVPEPEGIHTPGFDMEPAANTGFTNTHAIFGEMDLSEQAKPPYADLRKTGDWKEEVDDFHETVLLSAGKKEGPATLVSKEPGELATIYLNEELTVIGKMKTAADVVIPLPTISRIHAKIRRRDQQYYLTDLNSRNGTAVNGRMLRGEEECLLQNEDEVDFAQARYIFLA